MINRAEAGSRRRRCPFSAGLWARPARSPRLSPQLPLGLPRAQLLRASALPARPPARRLPLNRFAAALQPMMSARLRAPSHTSRAAAWVLRDSNATADVVPSASTDSGLTNWAFVWGTEEGR